MVYVAPLRRVAWASRARRREGLVDITPSLDSSGWGRTACAQLRGGSTRQTASLPSSPHLDLRAGSAVTHVQTCSEHPLNRSGFRLPD